MNFTSDVERLSSNLTRPVRRPALSVSHDPQLTAEPIIENGKIPAGLHFSTVRSGDERNVPIVVTTIPITRRCIALRSLKGIPRVATYLTRKLLYDIRCWAVPMPACLGYFCRSLHSGITIILRHTLVKLLIDTRHLDRQVCFVGSIRCLYLASNLPRLQSSILSDSVSAGQVLSDIVYIDISAIFYINLAAAVTPAC